jgi:hypothetical protein
MFLLLPSSCLIVLCSDLQLLSGHCTLNFHQYRFGFSALSSAPVVTHLSLYLTFFFIAKFSPSYVYPYLSIPLLMLGSAAPSAISTFPKFIPFWHSLICFVTKSKRLVLNQIKRVVQPILSGFCFNFRCCCLAYISMILLWS